MKQVHNIFIKDKFWLQSFRGSQELKMWLQIRFSVFLLLLQISEFQNGIYSVSAAGKYTEKERAAIDELRPLVKDYLTQDFMKDDNYLLRWLKGSKFNVNNAMEKLKTLGKWRTENNIDNILNEDLRAHQRYLPYRLDGFDRVGAPILQLYFGKWQFRKYAISGKQKDVLRQWWQIMEKAERKVYEASKNSGMDQELYFLDDLGGFNLVDQACLPCTPMIYDITRSFVANHPYFLKNVTLINVPRAFIPVLSVIKTILPGQTTSVIHQYGHNKEEWQPAVLRDISPEQIPPVVGGTKLD